MYCVLRMGYDLNLRTSTNSQLTAILPCMASGQTTAVQPAFGQIEMFGLTLKPKVVRTNLIVWYIQAGMEKSNHIIVFSISMWLGL